MRKKRSWIIIIFIIAIGLFFFSNQNLNKKKAIHNKVKQGLTVGIRDIISKGPRTLMKESKSSFYVPDIFSRNKSYQIKDMIYKDTLVNVSQDLSSPLCKITKVIVNENGRTIDATATVYYRGFFGIKHRIVVQKEMKSPEFKKPTGDAHY